MIADYNQAYLHKKALGMSGWDSVEVIQSNLDNVIALIKERYIPKDGTFLDIGCGAGNITIWMAEQDYSAYGIDVSEVAIQWAEESALMQQQKINFRVGDFCDSGHYSDDFFDFVLDIHCLHCIIGEDRGRLLSNVYSILKPGGLFIVMTMCDAFSHINIIENSNVDSQMPTIDISSHRYIGSSQDILKEIRESGFSIVKWMITGNFSKKESSSSRELIVVASKPISNPA